MKTNIIVAGLLTVGTLSLAGNAQATIIGYVVRGGTFYKIDRTGGAYVRTALSTGWGTPTSMAYKTWVHLIAGSQVWRVSTTDGSGTVLNTGRSWSGATNMEWNSTTGKLYIVNAGWLYRMDNADNNGTYTVLGNQDWFSTSSVSSLGSWLYIIRGSSLYKVNPNDGTRTQIGSSVWSGPTEMTKQKWDPADPGNLYVLSGDDMYKVNPDTGSRTVFGPANAWAGFTTIFCHASATTTSALHVTHEPPLDDELLWRVNSSGQYFSTNADPYNGTSTAAGTSCFY